MINLNNELIVLFTIENVDFFKIPHLSKYAISRTGRLIHIPTMSFVKEHNFNGYINFAVLKDNCKMTVTSRHRLLGIVFIPHKVPLDKLFVNHINGIPGDDRLENLEWVTPQQNCIHAGYLQLTSKCCPIEVRDSLTGEITEYPSIVELARLTGVTKDNINYRVKSRGQRVFPELKQYKLKFDSIEWLIPDDLEYELEFNGRKRSLLIKNVFSNEVKEFTKMLEASKFLGIAISTLSVWLTNEDQPFVLGKYLIKFKTNLDPWREITNPYLESDNRSKLNRYVYMMDTQKNISKVYSSAKECADENDLTTTALNYRLTVDSYEPWKDKKIYRYYSNYQSNNS